jgi:hypothetical protein
MFVYIILATLAFVLFPDQAYAWGPGTHVEIAFSLLEKIREFSPLIQQIISGREEWFVYGNIAADTIVGKKFAGEHHHCHNWHVAQKVLSRAKTDREKAAALGYLTHLASDVVAHNYYIPFKMMESYRARFLSHTYWEMRFDMHVRPSVWKKMSRMIKGDFSPFDRLLERTLKRALFSFRTSKRIYAGILAVQKLGRLRGTFSIYARRSRFKLDTKEISHYRRLATAFAGEALMDPEGAHCLSLDPTGDKEISGARAV